MKFLIIASYPHSLINFRGALLLALKNAGYEIHLAAPDFDKFAEDSKKLEELGYILHDISMQRTGTNPIKDAKTLIELFMLIKRIQPQCVLSYTIKPVIYGTIASWMANVPQRFALITGLGYAFQKVDKADNRTKLQKMIHNLYKQALSKAHKVFFQNPDDLNLFQDLNLISDRTPTTVVNGSGVDVTEYDVAPLPKLNGQPEVRFLMIARLLKAKGVREYAKSAKAIKSKYPLIQFDLVGWIDDNPDAIDKKELDSWLRDDIFNYWGKLQDVKPAIASSSVFVLPSYREGTPRTVLEAMSMGRPIITTDAPGCRETVINGYNGYLVDVKSVDQLTSTMETFINQPDLIVKMGTASRQLVTDKFDVNKVNKFMLTEMGLK